MDDAGRYRLLLMLEDKPAMHGWWAEESTAYDQLPVWVGKWGVPGARITLVDTETGETLAEWPEEP